MSRFYFGTSSDSSDSDSESRSELPFPAPLSRAAFSNLDVQFSAPEFLASLRNRHQTLEDLRAELRTRSRELEKELVELVNRDYADFVGLGGALEGGDGRVVDLKMGLLEFRNEVEGVAGVLAGVAREVGREIGKREEVRRQKILARNLLSLSQRLDEVSSLLLLDNTSPALAVSLFDEEGPGVPSVARLKRTVTSYLYITRHLLPRVPAQHPFVRAQLQRIDGVRRTLLLDLDSALRRARVGGDADKCLVIMGFYADLDAEGEAVRVLKEARKG